MRCPKCDRPTAGDICPAHGYVGIEGKPTESPFTHGMIVMFSGTTDNIPIGWAICDGTNGTPDLRDRFIVGSSVANPVGTTGGSNAQHTHSISVSVTVDACDGNSGSESSHTHSEATTGTGYADLGGPSGTLEVSSGSGNYVGTGAHDHTDAGHTHSGGTTGAGSSHLHEIDHGHSASGSGSAGNAWHVPAYYALALIMKL